MKERSTTRPAAPIVSEYSDGPAPLLVCFSHLRWDFVWQRPQHLLSRAAKHYRVLVIEEPVFRPSVATRISRSATGRAGSPSPFRFCRKGSAARMHHGAAQAGRAAARPRAGSGPRIFWYYTPMALAFTSHLECDLCVYDNMDELSAFRGASAELLALEKKLFAQADLVFTGGMSLYEAKRSRHRSVHAVSVEHRVRAFRQGAPHERDRSRRTRRASRTRGSASSASSTSAWTSTSSATLASLRPDWHFVMIGPVVKIDPATLAAAPQHPLARRQELRRASALSLGLGRRLHAVRAERSDALHQPDQDARVPGSRRAGGVDGRSPTWCAPTARKGSSRSRRRRRRWSRRRKPCSLAPRSRGCKRSTGTWRRARGTRPGPPCTG